MPTLNFKEIPEANLSSGEQDTFELFARDFLEYVGYKVLSGPDRGADSGRDLIISEIRKGVAGETEVKWMVSCKHNAHSGKSVGPSQEIDIVDRTKSNHCNGFLGFYSTLPSAGLTKKLDGMTEIETKIYDGRAIIKLLLKSIEGIELAKHYFPKSIKLWLNENPTPSRLFSDTVKLNCDNCGKDLLDPPSGNYVFLSKYPRDENVTEVMHIYFACKDKCDEILSKKFRKESLSDGWDDIEDLTIPIIYIKSVMSVINNLHDGNMQFSEEAMEKLRKLFVHTYPFVSREQTQKEKEIIKKYLQFPEFMGGLGKG